MDGDVLTSTVRSFTRGSVFEYRVDKRFILPGMRVLIIDDFLADGQALSGLIDIVAKAGAEIVRSAIDETMTDYFA